jgi:DNA-directed RNA polymerase sigma subunit (sigma70/sigma32)
MQGKYEEIFNNFLSTHQDLVGEYEMMESIIPLEYCEDDIEDLYNNLLKVDKSIKYATALESALKYAIKYNTNIVDGYESFISNVTSELQSNNSTQRYFKEINDIYNKHDNNYDIEYCPENRDKLIEMNLKTVISIAKKYQGLGLTLNELISAGNLGLVIAWDKFDPSRSELKDNMLNIVDGFEDEVSYEYFDNAVSEYLSYGDIKKKFAERFNPHNTYKKSDIIKWIHANIYNAKFNSIATMWIRAYILIEIDNNSRIVKKPKTEIYKDREEFGAYKKEVTVDIDEPLSDSSDISLGDILTIEDDAKSEMEVSEAYDTFKNGLNLLLDGVKTRDRTIFLKKFGIGLPRPMLPKEIADQEGLSIARISQIFQTVMEQMQKNQIKYDINPDILFDAVKKIQ